MCVEFNATVGGTMSKKIKTGTVIGITIGIAAALILICILLFFLLWRRRVQKLAARNVEEDDGIDIEDSCRAYNSLECFLITFSSLI